MYNLTYCIIIFYNKHYFFIFSGSDTVRINCKVIYNKFLLPVKTRMREGSESITEMDSGNEPIVDFAERSLQNDSGGSSAFENKNYMEASEHRSSR